MGEPSVLQMAWSRKRVPSVWDFCVGVRSSSTSSTDKPAPTRLPLLTRLPRCEKCQSVLEDGRCFDYDCRTMTAAANQGKKQEKTAVAAPSRCKHCGVELDRGMCKNYKCRSHR